MEYRHITNLRTPFDAHDQDMLMALAQDYKLGDPIRAPDEEGVEPVEVPTMKANGIVGLYVTLRAATTDIDFKQLTGWEITPEAWAGGPLL